MVRNHPFLSLVTFVVGGTNQPAVCATAFCPFDEMSVCDKRPEEWFADEEICHTNILTRDGTEATGTYDRAVEMSLRYFLVYFTSL
jgi:hypothetical protein